MSYPIAVGSTRTETPTTLAERAIEAMGRSNYDVSLDRTGKVWVDRYDHASPTELLAVATRKSDPDWLAEEIRFEARHRAGKR
ncbi:MAG: hypothetical protein WKF61_06185 [Luteimonas sp.]